MNESNIQQQARVLGRSIAVLISVLSYEFFLHKASNQPMLYSRKLMVSFREPLHDAREHGRIVCKYLIRKSK